MAGITVDQAEYEFRLFYLFYSAPLIFWKTWYEKRMLKSIYRLIRPEQKEKALSSSDLESIFLAGSSSSTGVQVTENRAIQVATVYACVKVLAESIAQLPLKVYRTLPDGGREAMHSDPLADVLVQAPNGWMTSFEFRELMLTCLCLRGNFYAYINRTAAGKIVELLPIAPHSVMVKRSNWELYYDIDLNGKRQTVTADKILHVRGTSLDGMTGVSPIACQKNAIGLAIATEHHGAKVFKNGARPGGVLKHPGKLSDEALKFLRDSWNASHSGDNSGGTAILEEGMDYASVAMTNQDAQYLDARGFQRTEICSIFRVPPHMIGDLSKSSFSNITQQSLEFVKYTILPWCRRIESAFHRDLLTEQQRKQGIYVEMLVDGLERADIKTRYSAYKEGINNGWLSPNEVRKKENMNPREGGDIYLIPLNMTDSSKAPEIPKAEDTKALCGCETNHKSAVMEEDFVESEGEVFYSDEVAGLNAIVDHHREVMRGFFKAIVDREGGKVNMIIAAVYGAKSADQDFVLELEKLYGGLEDDIRRGLYPLLKNYANMVGVEVMRMVGGNAAKLTAELDMYVRGYVNVYAMQHTGASLGQLKALIRDTAPEKISAVLAERVKQWMETRGDKIADDESIRFANGYARDAWASHGVTKLRWVNQGSKVCPFCKKMNGKIVGIEEPFLKDGDVLYASDGKNWMAMKGKKSHPPIHRKCVCAIVPELADFMPINTAEADGFIAKRNGLPDQLRPFLTQYTTGEYRQAGAKLFLSETGHAGFAIKADGELVSVFSLPGLMEGNNAAYEAVKNGAKYLWCFDTGLIEFYERQGFKSVTKEPWNDSFAPDGWDHKRYAKPDVHKMVLPGMKIQKSAEQKTTGGHRSGNLWIEEDGTVKTLMAKMGEMGGRNEPGDPAKVGTTGSKEFQDLAKLYLKECFDFDLDE